MKQYGDPIQSTILLGKVFPVKYLYPWKEIPK